MAPGVGRGRAAPPTPVYGLHAVAAALEAGRGLELWLARREGEATVRLRRLAERQGVPVRRVEAEAIREQAPGGGDQGCLLLARPLAPPSLGAVVAGLADREQAVVLLLDRVQDPHNLGSCLRTAACFGAAAVVVPRRRAAALTPAAVKAASGAAERLPVVAVGSLLDAAERLRGAGFWLYAAEEGAPRPAWEADLTGRVALILGGEGGGVRQSLLRAADATLHLAPPGPFATLNVAAATAALLYEAARQRAVDLPRGRV